MFIDVAVMEKFIRIGDVNVFYREEGSGSPILLVHGNGLAHGQWKHNISALSRYYKVYAPDLPGFGQSDKPDVNYGRDYYVNFLVSFMEALGLPCVAIAGSSFGGSIAASFSALYPDKVSALILSDASGLTANGLSKNKEVYNFFLSLLIRSRNLYCRQLFFDGNQSTLLEDTTLVTDSKETRGAFMKNCNAMLQYDERYVKSLMGIKAPTLVIWGMDDLLLPVSDAEKYGKLIPGSRVIIFDKCGHIPNVEQYARYNTAVFDFLASLRL